LACRDAPALPGRIEDSFRARVALLGPETQRLLLVAAAEPLGDPVLVWRDGSGSAWRRRQTPTGYL
jgi:hypothetical protein